MAAGLSAEANRFERHRYLVGFCIGVAFLLFSDAAAGLGLHLYRRKLLWARQTEERHYRQRNGVYHHDLAPNVSVDQAAWGPFIYPLRTNSEGFKDRVVSTIDRRQRVDRVLFMGDSFTEGVGIAYDSTFVGRLAAVAARHSVEIANGAVASYSPLLYWRKTIDIIDRRKLDVGEEVVFIDISDIEDEVNYFVDSAGVIQTHYSFGFFGDQRAAPGKSAPHPWTAVWAENSLFVVATFERLRHAFDAPVVERPSCPESLDDGAIWCRGGWTNSDSIMRQYGSEGLHNAQLHMSELAAFLRARKIPLTVVVYPWPEQLRWNDRQSLQVRTWSAWAQREHVGFVELFGDFFRAADSASTRAVIDRDFMKGDVHWSAAGHRSVALDFRKAYCSRQHADAAPTVLARGICLSDSLP